VRMMWGGGVCSGTSAFRSSWRWVMYFICCWLRGLHAAVYRNRYTVSRHAVLQQKLRGRLMKSKNTLSVFVCFSSESHVKGWWGESTKSVQECLAITDRRRYSLCTYRAFMFMIICQTDV
jgi:hypothetical protein